MDKIIMGKTVNKQKVSESADLLKVLSTYSRLQIICWLCEHGEANVASIAEALGLEQPNTSHQLARLRREGLVTTRRDGPEVFYRITSNKRAELAKNIINQCGCLQNKL